MGPALSRSGRPGRARSPISDGGVERSWRKMPPANGGSPPGRACAALRARTAWNGLAGAAPKAIYTRRDGLPGDEIFAIFADSHDGIWIGTIGLEKQDGMALFDRKTGTYTGFLGGGWPACEARANGVRGGSRRGYLGGALSRRPGALSPGPIHLVRRARRYRRIHRRRFSRIRRDAFGWGLHRAA